MKKLLVVLVIDVVMIIFLLMMFDTAQAEYVSSHAGLCVRKEPGTQSEVLEVLPFGEEVSGEIEAGWMRLEGREGYVCAEHLQGTDPFEELQYMGQWRVTAYAETGMPCANGHYPERRYTIACNSLPFGTEVYIEGVGFRTVEDRGPASMGDEWLDLYLGEHTECVNWGNQYLDIYVWRQK